MHFQHAPALYAGGKQFRYNQMTSTTISGSSVAFGNGVFVTNTGWYSSDGLQWRKATSANNATYFPSPLCNIVFAPTIGRFYCLGVVSSTTTAGVNLFYSVDGDTWTKLSVGYHLNLVCIILTTQRMTEVWLLVIMVLM